MAPELRGQIEWSGTRDDEGYREYRIRWLVKADVTDGPAAIMQTPGLPLPGTPWLGDDVDLWVWCRPAMTIQRHQTPQGERGEWWTVEQIFSNKPPGGPGSGSGGGGSATPGNSPGHRRCMDVSVDDPLLELPKISGGAIKYTAEGIQDKDGLPIFTSSHEQIRGPQNEWDESHSTIKIEQNVPTIYYAASLPDLMMDCVNDSTLWGYPPRSVKLSNYTWEELYYGACYRYYKRVLEFEIRQYSLDPLTLEITSGFDRRIVDEGTKCLRGRWDKTVGSPNYKKYVVDGDADEDNPQDFITFIDWNGNPAKVILDGHGRPAVKEVGTGTGTEANVGRILVQKYIQVNLLALGIPLTIGA